MKKTDNENLEADAWSLLTSKEYKNAIVLYTKLVDKAPTPHLFFNRGLAYLGSFDPSAAYKDFTRSEELKGFEKQTSGDYIFQGTSLWMLEEYSKAIGKWKRSLESNYVDASGGVESPLILIYGALRRNDMKLLDWSLKKLENITTTERIHWPCPVGMFILGKISDNELLRIASNTRSVRLKERQLCQSRFYLGVKGLLENNHNQFKKHLNTCSNTKFGFLEHEFYIALWEKKRKYESVY